jgi:signal transduction histidine kinase
LDCDTARALVEVARSTCADFGVSIRRIVQFDAQTMHVDRVNFWSLIDRGTRIQCEGGYVASTGAFEHGAVLGEVELPEYFEAMREARILRIADVADDWRCQGLREYCASRGVTSMLDVPVWVDGRLAGVLCHEHVGRPRVWSAREEEFAMSVGAIISSALSSRAHTRADAAAKRSALLDGISRAMMSSLDVPEIAHRATSFIVSNMADVSLVWLIDQDGALVCAGSSCADPAQTPFVAEAVRFLGSRGEAPKFVEQVVRQKQSLLVPEATPAALERYAIAQPQLDVLKHLDVRAVMGVPLTVGPNVRGAMTFICCKRSYDEDDLSLAEEVASRVAAALENARHLATAREAIRARDEFLILASHELRTPLCALQLMTDEGSRRANRSGDGREAKRAESITRQVRRLNALVEHMLEAVNIRATGVALARASCDLVAIVQRCVRKMADRAQRAGSAVAVQAPPELFGSFDERRLEQAVLQLLDNAIKFGRGAPIHVRVEERDRHATIAIHDHGPGIAANRLESIFAPFDRGIAKEHYAGLGLGLFIAKAIVDAHGGTLDVSSSPDGTTFAARLPMGSA